MAAPKTMDDVRAFARAVAGHQGWALNPDGEHVDMVLRGLLVNHGRHGFFMCPCRDGDGDPVADKDIRCPCAYAPADLAEFGQCFCGLFLTTAFADSGRMAESIPERRPEER